MPRRILIVGASARAAAQSAVRGGLQADAVDLFGDSDLRRIAQIEVCPASQYPHSLPTLARRLPPGPFCYVGGLENHPRILSQIQCDRALYGVEPAVLEKCRDPFLLSSIARDHGLPTPDSQREIGHTIPGKRWLRKPFASCGGKGVCFSTPGPPQADCYFQEFKSGPVYSASFLATTTDCQMLGVARQFTANDFGTDVFAAPFTFMGAVGPVSLDRKWRTKWEAIGRAMAAALKLRGLFGVDAVWNREQGSAPILLELNPRFTASMEFYDLSRGPHRPASAMGMHVAAFERDRVDISPRTNSATLFGKAIVYAPADIQFDAALAERLRLLLTTGEWFADLPIPPQAIRAGQPLMTTLTHGRRESEVIRRLGFGQEAGIVQRLRGELVHYHTKTDCTP